MHQAGERRTWTKARARRDCTARFALATPLRGRCARTLNRPSTPSTALTRGSRPPDDVRNSQRSPDVVGDMEGPAIVGPLIHFIGAPGEIRTPDLLVRSQTLYPTELRARCPSDPKSTGGERGIRTLEGLLTLTPLAGARLRPLGHLSVMQRAAKDSDPAPPRKAGAAGNVAFRGQTRVQPGQKITGTCPRHCRPWPGGRCHPALRA